MPITRPRVLGVAWALIQLSITTIITEPHMPATKRSAPHKSPLTTAPCSNAATQTSAANAENTRIWPTRRISAGPICVPSTKPMAWQVRMTPVAPLPKPSSVSRRPTVVVSIIAPATNNMAARNTEVAESSSGNTGSPKKAHAKTQKSRNAAGQTTF